MKHPLNAGIVTALLMIGSVAPALAQQSPSATDSQPGSFAEFKQRDLARLARYIAVLQKEAACVQAAADKDALRNCAELRRQAVNALKRETGEPN